MHFPLITLLTCSADNSSPVNLTERDMQRMCLRQFLKPRSFGCQSLLLYFERSRNTIDDRHDNFETDECTWRGVVCENQRMIEMNIDLFHKPTAVVDMDWLPSSLRRLRFHEVTLKNGWTAEALPRDLQFFHMKSYRMSTIEVQSPRDMHFQCLPANMEELYSIYSPVHGIVCIDNLPATMRILMIYGHSCQEAFVSFERLPESLRLLSLHCDNKRKGVIIHALGKIKDDKRVTTHYVREEALELSHFRKLLS